MLRGLLKPMPEYKVHYRANIMIPEKGREFVVDEKALRDFEERPDGILVMSKAGYDYMRAANGKQLVVEPLGGALDGASQIERIAALEAENERLRGEIERLTRKRS